MNFCTFIDKLEKPEKLRKKIKFTNAYYAALNSSQNNTPIVKNTYEFKNNLIITGPNAAGKTTLLKSTIFNISRQLKYFREDPLISFKSVLYSFLSTDSRINLKYGFNNKFIKSVEEKCFCLIFDFNPIFLAFIYNERIS